MLNKLLTMILICSLILINMAGITVSAAYTFEEVIGSLAKSKGKSLLGEKWYAESDPQGVFTMTEVDVKGQSFKKALRFVVPERYPSAWDAQVFFKFDSEIKKGDILFYSYKIRGIESFDESTYVKINARLRALDGDNTSINCDASAPISEEWTQVYGSDIAQITSQGKSNICMHLGLAKQTVEVADLMVINFGNEIALNDLPVMKQTYVGIEEDAPWRASADERIEEMRKGDIKLNLVSKDGEPVSDAKITINQTRHKYGFGSIVNIQPFQDQKFKDTVKSISNRSGFENALKMNFITDNEKGTADTIKWFKENDIDVRGHTLIWGQFHRLPADRRDQLSTDPKLLKEFTIEYIKKYVDKYKDDVYIWDVVNEPYSSKDFSDLLGREVMIDWFKTAREADPDCLLALNDYAMISYDIAHQDFTYDLIKYLIDNGAPLDVIGMQGHVQLVPPEKIISILDRFAELDRDIEITEFTFPTRDEELQAEFTRDFLTSVFSHPTTTSIVAWGFWEGWMFEKDAAMFRSDYSIKPNGEVWMDLIYNKWWTKDEGLTDDDGSYGTRAFLGKHEVTVSVGGKEAKFDIALDLDGKLLEMTYDGNEIKLASDESLLPEMPKISRKIGGVDYVPEVVVKPEYPSFTDISGHWAEDYITSMIYKNVVNGFGDQTFRPDAMINCDAFIKMVVAMLGEKASETDGYWAEPWINKAIELGLLLDGEIDNYDRPITRAEMAMISARALGDFKNSGISIDEITDYNDITDYFKPFILEAYYRGIIFGYDDGSFRPDNNATRAEGIAILTRIYEQK